MIKWIISDMDGTLLVEPNKLPDDFDEIMDLLKQHNIMFSPASGRQYQALVSQFPKYKDDLLFISENGTYVCQHDKEIFSATLPDTAVQKIIAETAKLPKVEIVLSGKKGGYIISQNKKIIAETAKLPKVEIVLSGKKGGYIISQNKEFHDELNLYYTQYKILHDFSEVDDEIIKISLCDCFNRDSINNIYKKFLPLADEMQVVLSSDIWVDIIPLGINKGVAIQKLQKKLNIKPEECVAFGDYLNDYEMMQSVYYSYAMENAIPELKKVARYIAPPNYKNGVVKTIRQLLAQQESNH